MYSKYIEITAKSESIDLDYIDIMISDKIWRHIGKNIRNIIDDQLHGHEE